MKRGIKLDAQEKISEEILLEILERYIIMFKDNLDNMSKDYYMVKNFNLDIKH
jgi:hypothetical protein